MCKNTCGVHACKRKICMRYTRTPHINKHKRTNARTQVTLTAAKGTRKKRPISPFSSCFVWMSTSSEENFRLNLDSTNNNSNSSYDGLQSLPSCAHFTKKLGSRCWHSRSGHLSCCYVTKSIHTRTRTRIRTLIHKQKRKCINNKNIATDNSRALALSPQ